MYPVIIYAACFCFTGDGESPSPVNLSKPHEVSVRQGKNGGPDMIIKADPFTNFPLSGKAVFERQRRVFANAPSCHFRGASTVPEGKRYKFRYFTMI